MDIFFIVIFLIGFAILLAFFTLLGRIAAATERIARALEDNDPE